MPKIKFIKEKKEIEVPEGANLRKEGRSAGITMNPGIHKYLNCQGFGMCGSCRVRVVKGEENLSQKGLQEKMALAFNPPFEIGEESDIRLACRCKITGDVEVESAPEANWFGENFFS